MTIIRKISAISSRHVLGSMFLAIATGLFTSPSFADIGQENARQIVLQLLSHGGYVASVDTINSSDKKLYVVHYVYDNGEKRAFTIDSQSGQLLY